MMTYFLIYAAIGTGLGFLFRVENDKFAIFADGLGSVFLFVVAWPMVVLEVIDLIIERGVVMRIKGKVVWRSKGR